MNAKQKRFCEEYIIDCNATQAAIRAGYSKRTAYSIGNENLKKTAIKTYINILLKKIEDEKIAKAEEVLKYLTSVMRGESSAHEVVVEGQGDGISKSKIITKPLNEKGG